MPALQPLTVNAGDINFDFEPVGISNGLASYQATKSTVAMDENGVPYAVPVYESAVLQPTLTISLQKPSKTSRISKARFKVVIPKPVFVDGAATAAKSHENSVDITFISSERATSIERAELVNVLNQLISSVTAMQVVQENKAIY